MTRPADPLTGAIRNFLRLKVTFKIERAKAKASLWRLATSQKHSTTEGGHHEDGEHDVLGCCALTPRFPWSQILCRLFESPSDETIVYKPRSPVCIHDQILHGSVKRAIRHRLSSFLGPSPSTESRQDSMCTTFPARSSEKKRTKNNRQGVLRKKKKDNQN